MLDRERVSENADVAGYAEASIKKRQRPPSYPKASLPLSTIISHCFFVFTATWNFL